MSRTTADTARHRERANGGEAHARLGRSKVNDSRRRIGRCLNGLAATLRVKPGVSMERLSLPLRANLSSGRHATPAEAPLLPFHERASPLAPSSRPLWTTDVAPLSSRAWEAISERVSDIGSVAGDRRRASDRFVWRRFWLRGGRRTRFGACSGRAASAPAVAGALGRSVRRALGCRWARVDDVSKSRRLGLVGLPRDLPFEGLIYARPGVTLAPTSAGSAAFAFAGDAACQSRTVRL
jgi:hypothetical protein